MGTNGVSGAYGRKAIARNGKTHAAALATSPDQTQDDSYRVGHGRPPRQFQFKPGQSGNPSGSKRKDISITRDLKEALERALSMKITLDRGEKQRTVTKAAAGIENLVDRFAKGDRFAQRDLIALAKALGVDLTMGQGKMIETALIEVFAANDQALLDDYVQRRASERVGTESAPDSGAPDEDDSAGAEIANPNGDGRASWAS
jgi:hypothetical protein